MSARNRPRAGQLKEEVDEERTLWTQIQADARKIDSLVVSLIFLFVFAMSSISFAKDGHVSIRSIAERQFGNSFCAHMYLPF